MTRDSRVPESSSLDSGVEVVCDEFRRALVTGMISPDGQSTIDFDIWLQRVDPPFRGRLANQLLHMHHNFIAASVETSDLLSTNVDFISSPGDRLPSKVSRGSRASESNDASDGEIIHDAAHHAVFSCPTLVRLRHEVKAALAENIQSRCFARGERLIEQGLPTTGLYILQSGRVEVLDRNGAKPTRIDYDGAGSVLGEMSLLTGQVCSADVVAVEPTEALVLSANAFESLRHQYPELEIALSQLVSDRLGQRPHDALCGKVLGGFRLNHCISRGAMGVVYAAQEETTGTPRALKMLRHRFIADARAQTRFDFEVDLLSKLHHDHIVRTHGHFVAYRTRFLVLDLCDGSDLKRSLMRHGPMTESTVRAVLGQIASGLLYAHQHGALHLDLKPANVLVDKRGHVALTDFGLGRLIRSDGVDDTVAGTPSYMSPEQFKAAHIGPPCDWYSLGCLGYELLTGTLLFPEQDLAEMFNRKHFLAAELWPANDISQELRAVLHAALEPMVEFRDLDLARVASWAKPVPELTHTMCD